MRELYKITESFSSGYLDVGDGHEIYYEQSGAPEGQPVIYLHGGPGYAPTSGVRAYFNPDKYRLIVAHQRGAGKSKFTDYLKANTTWDLVADMEKLREFLKIGSWHITGGSWGSTLALAYAEKFPERVKSLNIYGIADLGSVNSTSWMYEYGANQIFPEDYQILKTFCKEAKIDLNTRAFYNAITGADREKALKLTKHIMSWDGAILNFLPDPKMNVLDTELTLEQQEYMVRSTTIMLHYFVNDSFLKPGQLLKGVDSIRGITTVIIQGRYDIVCPMVTAWQLHQAWPEAEFIVVPDSGHHRTDPGNRDQILKYADKFADMNL